MIREKRKYFNGDKHPQKFSILRGVKTMNEEMNINVIDEIENIDSTEAIEACEELETSGNGIIGKLVIGAVIVGVGVAALIYKNRDKIEQRQIRKLEKKGYIITKLADDVEEVEFTEVKDDSEEMVEGTES